MRENLLFSCNSKRLAKFNTLIGSFLIKITMQGVRRVVALTGAEARDAVTHAKELSEKLRELNDLSGPELEKHTTAFKVVMLCLLTSSSTTQALTTIQ